MIATASHSDFVRKLQLESGLAATPDDTGLRRAYFDFLLQFATVHTGLCWASLPELAHPLYFRCGTADVANFIQIFRDGLYAVPNAASPLQILDLGAYAGYATVDLARRYPDAQVLAIEPGADNFRILSLNTTPYERIRIMHAAAWHSAVKLGPGGRYFGDYGTIYADDAAEEDRSVQGFPVAQILAMAGWDHADFMKCNITGAETAVFADPGQRWLQTLDTLAVVARDNTSQTASKTIDDCFDPAIYRRTVHGNMWVYERHTPFRRLAQHGTSPQSLFAPESGPLPLELQDVRQRAWGFFIFDGDCCQLHPNAPGEPPPRVVLARVLDGQTRFAATASHAGAPSHDIVFTVIIAGPDGTEVARVERTLAAREQAPLAMTFPPLSGPHHIILQTDMAPGSTQNYNAWARFLSPTIA